MSSYPYLQSYVSSICRFTKRSSLNWVEQLHGTGFLISTDGVFLTARHVLQKANADFNDNGGLLGIFPMQKVNDKATSLTVTIDDYENAPEPFDIAIFSTSYKSPTPLRVRHLDVEVWQDVAAMGYPTSAANKTSEEFQVQQRAHKGYVQRVIPAGRLFPNSAPCFELNFAITNGLSGSPLFVHKGEYDIVIGVCVSSHQSRIVQHDLNSVDDSGQKIREETVRIEEFGIAHDLRPLLDWTPKCLHGKKLGEIS